MGCNAINANLEQLKIRGFGGEGGIRTHEGLSPLPVFKTGAFNRSATSPLVMGLAEIRLICQ
jgi:hypothetical protein